MSEYKTIVETETSTVVGRYETSARRSTSYQSEAALEEEFISILCEQGYERLHIHNSEELRANLRERLERLNDLTFADDEWDRFFKTEIADQNAGIVEKTRKIQEEPRVAFERADGSIVNITLFDRAFAQRNTLQVLNQYAESSGDHANRYDVTILVNGLPLVHVELKRRGVALKEAFNQIERYQRDSFWAGDGLFEYVQLFVISNGAETKYYSNTTREDAVKGKIGRKRAGGRSTFEFTSYWADSQNFPIYDLVDFARTFFARQTLLNILAKYCVFTCDSKLLAMRPYQIEATERIINKIRTSLYYKRFKDVEGGGYVWHTTGSGKTLTSFKTARLASRLPGLDRVLFVVDRRDLDYQTIKEYDRFEKGAANGSRNVAVLKRQLEDRDEKGLPKRYPIVVTTINKLQTFVKKNPDHPVFQKPIVLIFDECHRSQFGDMHQDVAKAFKKRLLFGFTGTPIFKENAPTKGALRTTDQAFGERLCVYSIVDAIRDQNVLPFRVDVIKTLAAKQEAPDKDVEGIDAESALNDPRRIENVVRYILEHFDQKTKRFEGAYSIRALTNAAEVARGRGAEEKKEERRVKGFNSIFAVSSVKALKLYYAELKKQLGERFGTTFKVATIFSCAANEQPSDAATGALDDENSDSADDLDADSLTFLEGAIADYNKAFGTAYSASADKFANYYKDVSLRAKDRQIDLLLVVNMFLTGFDAPTLNTLWVDKNLRMHGLLQAFSRTNRILNSVKTYGNIVCFRDLQAEIDESFALFGNREGGSLLLLRSYEDYLNGYVDDEGKTYKGYVELAAELQEKFPLREPILGSAAERDFIALFGALLRSRNILQAFDRFEQDDPIAPLDLQDHTSRYIDLRDKLRPSGTDRENINDDLVFEMELVRQIEVDIDYILALVKKYCESNKEDAEIKGAIAKAVASSVELRSKRDLVERFVESVAGDADVYEEWNRFITEQKEIELKQIVDEERLKEEETRRFIEDALATGNLELNGMGVDALLPPTSRFKKSNGLSRVEKKKNVIERLSRFFTRFLGF